MFTNRITILLYSVLNLIILSTLLNKLEKSSIRRWWTKPHIMPVMRDKYGGHAHLFTYFCIHDHEEFYNFIHISIVDFIDLYKLVKVLLIKKSRRKALSPDLRLAVVLHFLAHGGCVRNSTWLFQIGLSTTYCLIKEVCNVLSSQLVPRYVKFPDKQSWLNIADGFERLWNFPNCIGAIDSTHIQIKQPPHAGATFKNYKKFHSLVLMAACDHQRRFTWFNFGDFGSYSDASIFATTDLSKNLLHNEANLPFPRMLKDSNVQTPFVFVADEIFGLTNNIMKPFCRRNDLTVEEKIFNYRLSRARLNIECTFGIINEKWQILQKPLKFHLTTIDKIVTAIIGLHNYISYRKDNNIVQHIDENYHYHEELPNVASGIVIRNRFKSYFSAPEGAVPWQEAYI